LSPKTGGPYHTASAHGGGARRILDTNELFADAPRESRSPFSPNSRDFGFDSDRDHDHDHDRDRDCGHDRDREERSANRLQHDHRIADSGAAPGVGVGVPLIASKNDHVALGDPPCFSRGHELDLPCFASEVFARPRRVRNADQATARC